MGAYKHLDLYLEHVAEEMRKDMDTITKKIADIQGDLKILLCEYSIADNKANSLETDFSENYLRLDGYIERIVDLEELLRFIDEHNLDKDI